MSNQTLPEPHMNPGLGGGSIPGAEWMPFVVVGILVILVLFIVWARWHED